MLEGLDKLPAWVQIASFLGILIATTAASMAGWNRDKLTRRGEMNPAPGKDAVVMSAAIADSQAIRDLATAINRLVDRLDDDAEGQRDGQREIRRAIQDQSDATDRQTHLLRQILHPFAMGSVAPTLPREGGG